MSQSIKSLYNICLYLVFSPCNGGSIEHSCYVIFLHIAEFSILASSSDWKNLSPPQLTFQSFDEYEGLCCLSTQHIEKPTKFKNSLKWTKLTRFQRLLTFFQQLAEQQVGGVKVVIQKASVWQARAWTKNLIQASIDVSKFVINF